MVCLNRSSVSADDLYTLNHTTDYKVTYVFSIVFPNKYFEYISAGQKTLS